MSCLTAINKTRKKNMSKIRLINLFALFVVLINLTGACLITNCPKGGKRARTGPGADSQIKPCISCGPGRSGQCFGPNICCGPFGCLINTVDTLRCQRDGFFHEREPCIAGSAPCRHNTGRCAIEGICCSQESCHTDKSCTTDENRKNFLSTSMDNTLDLYSLLGYPPDLNSEM